MRKILRRYPVTIGYFLLSLVAGIATGFFTGPSPAVRDAVASGYEQVVLDGRWWGPLTAPFFADRGVLPIALVLIVAGVGQAERLLGSVRLVLSTLACAVIGTAVGITAQAIGAANGEAWSRQVRELSVVDPFLFVVGAVMTASGFCRPLWRRRLRVLILSTCLVFLLYSGQPSDLYRLVAALAGLVIGRAIRPERHHLEWFRGTHHEVRVLLAAVVTTLAVGPVITIFSGRRFGLLGPLGLLLTEATPTGSHAFTRCQAVGAVSGCLRAMTLHRLNSAGPVLLTLLPLVALLVAAIGLARGRRLALWLAVGVNVAMAALACYFYGVLPRAGQPAMSASLHRPTWEVTLSLSASILVPLLVSALLLRNLSHFTERAEWRRVRNYLVAMGVSLVALSALYVLGGWALRRGFSPHVTLVDLLGDLPGRFVPVGFLHLQRLAFLPTTPVTHLLYEWTGAVFWAVVIIGALTTYFDRGSRNFVAGLPIVQRLRHQGGGNSFSAWATWLGNSYWFAPDNRAVVAYRVVNGIAITTGAPIGDVESRELAIGQFARFCDDRGWTPVFYAVHDIYRPSFQRMGWRTMSVGEETVIRPQQWKTSGKRWQDIRSSISRAERAGIRAEWTTYAALSLSQVDQLHDMSEQWVAEKGLPEMGFTLGGLEELKDPETALMVALDEDDRILAITSWMPAYRAGRVEGWTLDFMRRAPDTINGVMEFLIARSAERFAADGAEFMSLSTAPLARSAPSVRAGEAHDDATGEDATGSIQRVLGWIAAVLEPVYGFRSLLKFKQKFQPEHHPVLLAYPDALVLPALGIALARAYLPSMSVRQSIRFMRSLT